MPVTVPRARMRILYLHQFFITREGVGGTRSYEFARRFVARGHGVRMVTAGGGRRRTVDGIEVVGVRGGYSDYVSATAVSYPRRMLAFARFALGATRRRAAGPAAGRDLRHLAAADHGAARARGRRCAGAPRSCSRCATSGPRRRSRWARSEPARAPARARARALRLRAQRARDRALARHPRRRLAAGVPSERSPWCRTPPTSTCSSRARGRATSRFTVAYFGDDGRGERPDRRPRGGARSCPDVRFVLMGDGKRRAELRARARRRTSSFPAPRQRSARWPSSPRRSERLPHALQGRARARHQLAQQALRHLRRGPARDREHGRLDARARGATTRPGCTCARATPARPGREGAPGCATTPTRPSAWARTRARWPSASSAATSSPARALARARGGRAR